MYCEKLYKFLQQIFTLSRPGGGIYGLDDKRNKNLHLIMTVKSYIIQLKEVNKGEGIGYNWKYTTPKKMRIAVLSLKNLTEGIVEKIMYNGQSFTAPLNNECDYELVASNEDFEDLSVKFNTKNILKSDTLQYDLVFKERKSFNNQVIGIVYYEYNQAKLTAEAPKTLEQVITFLKEYPKAQVEVSAHTDGNGADKYNLELSKGRCEAAVSYLTFNGIAKDRIVKNWFGESNPVAPEVNQDGSDNPDGRALNRRTEFKIKASN